MVKLISVPKAKQGIRELQKYVDLVENYEADTLNKLIIKEYTYTNSLTEVTKRMNSKGFLLDGKPIEYEYVNALMKSKPGDPLHKILRVGLLSRINASKNPKRR